MRFLFFSMFMDTPEDEKTKLISCLAAFRQFWNGLSQVRHFLFSIQLMTFDAPPFLKNPRSRPTFAQIPVTDTQNQNHKINSSLQ